METKESKEISFNDDIVGGLKAAIERGEELKEAMMTFYNAGYSKKEIEEAARVYVTEKKQRQEGMSATKSKYDSKKDQKEKEKPLEKGKKVLPIKEEKLEIKENSKIVSKTVQKPVEKKEEKNLKGQEQIASKYGDKLKPKKHKIEPITVILVLLLIFLVLILGSVFLFKEELITFFNNLVG